MKRLISCVIGAVVGGVWGDVVIDRLHTADVSVTEDKMEQADIWFADGAKKIEKSGVGAWKLSNTNIQTRGTAVLGVREGKLLLTRETERAALTAPACLQRAALWLDATQGASFVGGTSSYGEGVARWLDVREGSAGTSFYCAEAKANVGAGATEVHYPVLTRYADKPLLTYVNFNGKASGSWMRLLQPISRDDVDTLSQIRHVFLCGYVENAWGYPLGANVNNAEFWHPANLNGDLSYYISAYSSSRKMPSGESLLNGKLFDPTVTLVKQGSYLYEWDSANDYGWFGNFFNDRNIWSQANGYRCGGDSIGEVVVFTNRLTALERESVSEYLMRKWVKDYELGGYDVRLGANAALETEDLQGVAVSGAGEVAITGEDKTIFYAKDRAFEGTLRPTAARLKLEMGEPPLKLVAGDEIAITADDYYAHDVARSTRADLSANGKIALTVNENTHVRVAALADDVKRVDVAGAGEVILTAPRQSSILDSAPNGVYATMENADMEEWKRVDGNAFAGESSGTFCHWTIEENISGSLYFLDIGAAKILGAWIIDGTVKNNFSYINYPFEGNGIMVLARGKTVSNQVTFPADGDYELTFLSGGRVNGPTSSTPNSFAGGILKLALVDESGLLTNKIGTALGYVGTAQQFQRFRVRGVKAGCYKFVMKHDVGSNDMCMIVDDFKFRLVTDGARETVILPPNADFECANLIWEISPETRLANTLDDWTFTQTQASGKPDVCLVTRGFVNTLFRPGAEYGGVQLAFFGAGGTATSAAFTLPAGTWHLRLKKAGFESEDKNWCAWNGKVPYGKSAVSAALVVGTEELSFGTSTADIQSRLAPQVLPTAVTLTAATTVQLRLRGATAASDTTIPCAIIDELELVRETAADELITNGTFADDTGWTLKSDTSYRSNCRASVKDPCRLAAGVEDYPYGTTYGVNTTALEINHYASAEQAVTFPQKGSYRLEYSSRARVWVPKDSTKSADLSYAGNRARFYLIDANNVTNEIAISTTLDTTNFVFRSCVFDVPAAGTYTFGVMGVNGMLLADGTRAKSYRRWESEATFYIDQISVKSVPAATPDIPEGLTLNLSSNTRLRLDFMGVKELKAIRINGHRAYETIDATHPSGLVSGYGVLYAKPDGLIITIR